MDNRITPLRRLTQPKRFVFDSFPHGPMNVNSYEEQVKQFKFFKNYVD